MILGGLMALGGVGLVLAGLRGLTDTLTDSVSTRIRESVVPTLEKAPIAYGSGIVSAVLFQASAVTVLLVMALLHRGVVGVETAILVVLGATVGTALKTWLFVWPVAVLGPALVGLGSLLLVGTRRLGRRRLANALLHLGMIYTGWHLARTGLTPVFSEPVLVALMEGMDIGTMTGLGIVVSAGVLAAALVQSSSAVILLIVALLSQGVVSLPTGIALMLGANVGTALTPLLASIEYGPGVRVVALVHVVVKAVGVLLATMFFHTFVVVSSGVSEALGFGCLASGREEK